MNLENQNNKGNFNKLATLAAFVVFFFVLPFFTFVAFKNQLSNAAFWWPILNIKIETLLGSKLKCKKVYWCKDFEFCAKNCQTEDGITFAKFFSISLFDRKVTAKNWGLNSIPNKLSNRTNFPRIPIVIKKIYLLDGDLSAINQSVKDVNEIKLVRSGLKGQVWETNASIENGKVIAKGLTGDASSLQFTIHHLPIEFQVKSKNIQSNIDGRFSVKNKSFKQEPLDIIFSELIFSNNKINDFSTPNVKVNGMLELDKNWTKVLDLKDFDFRSGDFHLHTDPEKRVQVFNLYRVVRLILDPIELGELKPYLFLIPKQNDISLVNLSGMLSGFVDLNVTAPKDTKISLDFESIKLYMQSKESNVFEIGPISGNSDLKGEKVEQLNLRIDKQSLKALNPALKEKNFEITDGYVNGEFKVEEQKEGLKGSLEFSKVSGEFNDQVNDPRRLSFSNGNGNLKFKQKEILGDLSLNLQKKQKNKANFNILLKIPNNILAKESLKSINGTVKIAAPVLMFDEIKIKDPEANLAGGLKNITANIQIKNNIFKLLNLSVNANNFFVNADKLTKGQINLKKGKVNLNSKNQITIKDLFIALSDVENVEIDGRLKVKDLNSKPMNPENVTAEELHIDADVGLSTILDFISSVKGEQPRTWMKKIQNPTGFVSSKLQIKNSELKDTQISFDGVGIDYDGSKIRKGNGQIRVTESDKFQINDLKLNFGKHSSLALDGYFKPNRRFFRTGSANEFTKSLASFNGKVKGLINLEDFVSQKLQKKMHFSLSDDAVVPIDAEIFPGKNKTIQISLKSNFKNLGKLSSDIIQDENFDSSGYLHADANINPQNGYFNISDLECSIEGLNIIARAKGFPKNFNFKVFTDPVLDLGKLFKSVKGAPIRGGLIGWVSNKKVNIFEKKTFWENLQFSLRTDDLQSIEVGPIELRSLESYFAAKDGKGYATLVVDSGTVKNLAFDDLNVSFLLNNNDLKMPGLTFKTAGGETNLKGQVDLLTAEGTFVGETENVEVGEIARGLSNIRGLSGTGDFTFVLDGHLWSLIKGDKPVFGSGSFDLKNGNTSAILDLQKKLNLANLVFNGPLALNVNSLLEVLSPTNNGYYRLLSGEWEVDQDVITIKNAQFRGTSKLSLNMAGIYTRKSNYMDFNFVGSIPRIPIRTGTSSTVSNAFSQLNVANILGRAPLLKRVFDVRPRVFKFSMKGDANNQAELNATSSNSFVWMDSAFYSNLPMPELPGS